MSVANLRTGLAGQLMIATNALHDPTTIVTPNYALEFESESITDDVPTIRKQGIAGTLLPRSGRVRAVDAGMAAGDTVHALLNNGYARLLRHGLAGYVFAWPGSTNATAELTLAAIPTTGDTMTIGAQTYTFRTTLTASTTANEILIASTIALQCSYIEAAINRTVATDGNGSGVAYGSETPRNVDVTAVATVSTVDVTDRQARGTGANAIDTTETFTDAGNVFDVAVLTGGVDGTDTARTHTFTFDAQAMRELFATVQVVRPPSSAARAAWTHVGKPVSTAFAAADGDALMITPTWDMLSRTLATAIASPSYPGSATFFDYTQIGVTVDAVTEPVQGFDLTVNTAQESRSQFGQAARRQHLITDRPTITGNLTREFENTDIFNDWVNGTEAALVVTATGGLIPSSASNYSCVINCPDIQYQGATPNVGGPGIVQNSIPFEVLDDGSNEPITITYTTDEAFAGDDGA